MLLKYLGNVIPASDFENKVIAIAWSSNNLKLAVASTDRSIYLFDDKGVKRDRFSTKPVEAKYGKKSYLVKGIAFSPDSTKIAVGQTDKIVYVYKIGEEWGAKKVICNKFPQSSAVTCMVWPSEGPIIIGLADGKVRSAMAKANKAQTLYASNHMTIALAVNTRGTGFLSSHADGSIIRHYIGGDGNAEPTSLIVTHGVPAYALGWPQGHILAAGCDKKIVFYDFRGKVVKTLDFSRDPSEKEMTVACCSPSGQSIAVGSWDKVRIIDWSPRRSIWEETNVRDIPNFYTVTALSWRRDGSRLAVGGLCGSVEQFETILRRSVVRGIHEVAYVGPSQVVIRQLDGKSRPVIIKSQTGNEIEDVRVLGRQDNRVIARTTGSLLICDIELSLLSEIPWEDKNGGEKFFFDYPGVCLIFFAGELTIVEYGKNDILGSVRTEAVNPHVVSVRINERHLAGTPDNKRLAYLLDPRTVRIVDFVNGSTISLVSHDARVDWLELSETGHRLLSRDKRGRLWLSDDRGSHISLLSGVSFASWVPGSDVVVAQSAQALAVWYNVDAPEAATFIAIRGDAVDIFRENGQTSVVVDESGVEVAYILDEGLIEFGTALHDNDFGRVVLFLEELGDRPQAEAMWENVAKNAMSERQLHVAARCYAALGDIACAKFLKEIIKIGDKYEENTGNEALSCPECWAKIAILNGELKTAEAIYLEQSELKKALDMYQTYWHWEDAITLAQIRHWSGLAELKDKHLTWLMNSQQIAKAASIIQDDNPRRAIKLYRDARRPARAARLLLLYDDLMTDSALVQDVIKSLKSTDLMELAGEIYETINDHSAAIKSYAQAGAFARALELARKSEPNSVVGLERDWGHNLIASGYHDAAINHFIEAGETTLALNSAINAKQWKKALQIIQVIEVDDPQVKKHCEKLADHFVAFGETNLAENLYLRAGLGERAVDANIKAGNWSRAQEIATEHLSPEEANKLLASHADRLRQLGDLPHAEDLYITINQPDTAIAMYKEAGNRQDVIRLVAQNRPDLLRTTHAHLARELEAAGKPREAEEHFIGADDWRGAAAAYRSAHMWEDALRVAKQHGGDKAGQQVALMWARSLAPELGARLLSRLNYSDACLQLACEAGLFDWSLEIAKYGTVTQKSEVHYRYAMALEDEGRFSDAEREFLKAGKAMEAVQMYIHTRDWEAAEDVAQNHCQEGLSQVLVARASEAADSQDYAMAESLLLRAHKPEIIINHYKKAGMWSEAMRVCREYLPSQEAALRRELGQKSSQLEGGNVLDEARRWLEVGEVRTALDILILDPQASKSALIQAADILIHQAEPEIAMQVGGDLGARLFAMDEHALAAQVFLQADRLKDAINALAAVGDWSRAKRIVKELAPDLESYLEERYKDAMIKEGQVENLARVDADAALEVLVRKGQWTQVFETAGAQSPALLHKYVAQRAAQLLKSNKLEEALRIYTQYGTPPIPQNYNLYNRLSEDVLNSPDLSVDYTQIARLRTVLLELTKSVDTSSAFSLKFENLLYATHYSAVRCACRAADSGLSGLSMKTSVSLLRYSNIIFADRCYYDAGIEARNAGLNSEAFVFLNHFLDLEERIEENDGNILDVDDLRVTDFPLEVPLPDNFSLGREEREEVREWVLAISMNQNVEQGLPLDDRGVYVGSLTSPSDDSRPTQECVLTGYPIRGSVVRFEGSHRVADRDDWNKFVAAARQSAPDGPLSDVLVFIQEWCGAAPNYTF